jgi:ATP-dependent DNA helicase RecQ
LQEEVIQSVLQGKDTLALMPTGGGKSLCYQLPALAMEGLCLVISPLIALMKDQVRSLRNKNITAYSIFSGMSRKEVHQVLKTVINSNCKFLFVSPERLETKLFLEYLPAMPVSLLAVDEAHCISQWGYDFRPPYLRIASVREELPGVPVLALTASATPEVQRDICEKLSGTSGWNVFRQSFERPNLSYSVFQVESRISKILEVLDKVKGTGIIYCKSRKRTKEISDLLNMHQVSASFYHAGLDSETRNKRQEDWISDRTRVMVCTNAFGMGIDKPDVRTVIHADLPDCLENYYQEAGRAGRDGRMAYAVLLYGKKELHELKDQAPIHFPSLKEIREVYQAVANYLQLPAGEGAGNYFEFDLKDFLFKFNLKPGQVIYSLKALEQEGWMQFNEQVFLPSKIVFACNKEELYQFEEYHPDLEPLVKSLLRTYDGIFDQETIISESEIAYLLKKPVAEIKKELSHLHQARIIEYVPQKDKPQVYYIRNRVRTEELDINMAGYNKRKDHFISRVNEMTRYAGETGECRSRFIAGYFGDPAVPACGICDNCLRLRSVSLSKEEFESIHHRILNTIKYEPQPARDLLARLNGVKKEKAWKVIEFLQAENKIEMDKAGYVRLK